MGEKKEEFMVYEGGAKRQSAPPYYRIIPHTFLRRLADTLKHGALKYSEGPDDSNWKKGDKEFAIGCFDHLIEHLYSWREGLTNEDHLGHAAANLAFLAWFQEQEIWDPTLAIHPQPKPVDIEEDKDTRNSRLWDIIKKGVTS